MATEGRSEATRDSEGSPEDDTKRKFREALENYFRAIEQNNE